MTHQRHSPAKLVGVACLGVWACHGLAQGPGGMGEFPECDPDPPGGCEWLNFQGRSYNVFLREEEPAIESSVEARGAWDTFDACSCAWIPCDQRPTCPAGNLGRELQRQTC